MSEPYRMKRLGILNAQGGIWTPQTFDSDLDALAYIDAFKRKFASPPDMSHHTIVPVRVTVSVIKPRKSK